MVAYHQGTKLAAQFEELSNKFDWILEEGIMPQAFNCQEKDGKTNSFDISDDIAEVSDNFNKGKKESPFKNSGVMAMVRFILLTRFLSMMVLTSHLAMYLLMR